jgi:hypothetical protein
MRSTAVVLMLVVMVLGFGVVSAQAQQATPTRQAPADTGVIRSVSRSFEAQNVSFDSILAVSASVAEYEDVGLATEGMKQVRSRFLGTLTSDSECPEDTLDFSDLKEVSAPQIADGSLAFAGSVGEEDGIQGQVTILVFREAQFVYMLGGAAIMTDPMADLVDVAKSILAENRMAPPSGSEMRTGGLWDRLPTLQEVPPGLALESEEENAHLDDPADCEATPAASPAASMPRAGVS